MNATDLLLGMHPIDLALVVIYLLGIGALGVYQTVRVKTSGDFFAGGRKFSKWLMMMHALGTGTHADDPVGVVGASYQRGISGIWYTYVYLFCTPFYWIMAPLFRRSRYITTADFFKARFGDSMAVLYTIMGILTFAVNTGTLLIGTRKIVQAVTVGQVPGWAAVIGMTVIFVIYGTAGGLIATVVTESIQGILIVVMSLLVVPFGIWKLGGVGQMHDLVDPASFTLAAPQEMTPTWILAGFVMMLIGIVGQPHIMEVCSTGKTEFEGRVGFTYGNMIKRICAIGWAFTGIIVLAMGAAGMTRELAPEERELAFGLAIRDLLPVGATGLMFAAILAAQMSTLSAIMVAGSALFTRNIYQGILRPGATDAQVLRLGRFAGLIVVGLGVLFAFAVPEVTQALPIFWAMATFTGLFMWFGVLWRRTNRTGAWASFIVMTVIWLIVGPMGKLVSQPAANIAAGYPDSNIARALGQAAPTLGVYSDRAALDKLALSFLPVGVVALVLFSLLTKPEDKERLDEFYLLLRTPVGHEQKLRDAGVHVVYSGSEEPHRWEANHPREVNVLGFLVALAISLLMLGLLYGLAQIGA